MYIFDSNFFTMHSSFNHKAGDFILQTYFLQTLSKRQHVTWCPYNFGHLPCGIIITLEV